MCLILTVRALYNNSKALYNNKLEYTPVEACPSAPVIYNLGYSCMGLVIPDKMS